MSMPFKPEPGIYPALSISAYHLSDVVSKTGICQIEKAAKVYRYSRDNPGDKKKNRSLTTGSVFHVVMEGAFERDCRVGPQVDNKNKKEWKDFVAAHPNHLCVTPEERDEVFAMREAMLSNPVAAKYLSEPGAFEVSYFCIDEETGLMKKCRPDYITADQSVVLDFKTARNASPEKFPWDAENLHYHVSAAMTVDIIHTITGIAPRYIFLVIEPHAPYLVAPYEATANDLKKGREFVRRNLSTLKRCQENGTWPGLPEEIQDLDVGRRRSRSWDDEEAEEMETETPVNNWWKK